MVPRTDADAERIQKRGEKTKEVLFEDLKTKVKQARLDFCGDEYLESIGEYLASKNFKHFNPKSKLVKLVAEVEGYIENMEFESESGVVIAVAESEEEDDVEGDIDNLI